MAKIDIDKIIENSKSDTNKKEKNNIDIDKVIENSKITLPKARDEVEEKSSTNNTIKNSTSLTTYENILKANPNLTPEQRSAIEGLKNEKVGTTQKNVKNSLEKIEESGGLQNYMSTEGGELRTVNGNAKFKNKNGKIVLEEDGFFKSNDTNITQKILGTVADAGLNVAKGIGYIGENLGDLASYGVANVAEKFGADEYADRLRRNAQSKNYVDKFTQPIQDRIDNMSVLGNKSKGLAQGLGNVAGNAAAATFSGGMAPAALSTVTATTASTAMTFSSAMGSGMTEAYQEGANDDEATAYGLISGLGEAGTELLFGGLGKGTKALGLSKGIGGLDDQIAVGLTKNIKNKMAKTLIQAGIKSAGEGAEEVISGVISAIGKKATYMSEEELEELLKDQNLLDQFFMGALTSAIAEAPSVRASIKNGTDYVTLDYQDRNNVKSQDWTEDVKSRAQKIIENNQNELSTTDSNKDTFINQNVANNQETLYNNIALGEVKNIPIENVLPLITDGGYRTTEEVESLKNEIIRDGIKNPIELVRKNDGSIEIENGNHRLQIAKELGFEEVPIKFVESWENIGKDIEKSESNRINKMEEIYNGRNTNNGNNQEVNDTYERSWTIEGNSTYNNNQFENRTTGTEDARVYNGTQEYNNRPSSTSTFREGVEGNREIENSNKGSFLKENIIEEINKSNLGSEDKKSMLNAINEMQEVSNEDAEAIRQTIKTIAQSNELDSKGSYKNDQARRQKYMKYKNDTSDYDATIVNEVLDTIATNRNGRRTVKQWLNVANEIGTRIANKGNTEIEQIAYKSWFDLEPTKSITQYDNQAKKTVAFQKFTSDEWINTINNAVNNARKNTNVQNQNNEAVSNVVPKKDNSLLNETTSINSIPQNTQNMQVEDDNSVTNPEIPQKQREHYKSISESQQVTKETRKDARELYETDTYTPISNIETISKANENISRNGVDNTYIAFKTKMNNNEKVSLQDIATGERLIQIYSQKGDTAKVNDIMQEVAILGTELGQQVQALSIIKKASPEGQLMYLNKIVDRTNQKLAESKSNKNNKIEVTDEMANKILKSKNQQELENVMTDIAVELGEQIPISTGDKIRSWRYLSMLGNPKTHIKNLGANFFMNITQQLKNKVGGAVEDVAGKFNKNLERTKTLKFANKDQRQFAKQDAEYMKDKIDGGGKYDIKNIIENNKKQFDNKALNSIAEFNSNMLEIEDNIFLKLAYKQALQNYMSANKLTSNDMQNSSTLQRAREYASYQAQEATFHQFNALAQRLSEIENKGGIAGKAVEAVLPFKKTPMNIAKAGVEYSPLGLAKSLTSDIVKLNSKTKEYKAKLESGSITNAQYKSGTSKLVTNTIDNVAKGFTGTSLAMLGYFLADKGILKAGNNGDDDEFKEKEGEQEYSIRIGDYTYTLDWVAPSAIPVFIGGTLHDLIHSEKEDNSNILNSLMTATAKTFEPMTEMSMLQGLTSAISSYEQGSSNMIFDLGASALSSYAGQFVPTALGQVAKIIDPVERDTTSTEKGIAKKLDQFIKQQTAKVPFLSKTLPVKKDVWGEDKLRNSNILARTYEVAISPYSRKQIVEDVTNAELLSVFESSGENVLPGTPNKDLTINTQKYRMTSKEYNEAKGKFGQTSKTNLNSLISSSEYKKLTEEQKATAIDNVYSYAKEQVKMDYAKNHDIDYEGNTLYQTVNEIKEAGGSISDYFSYKAVTQGIKKEQEKIKILADSNYSNRTKKAIYENTIGSDDKKYEIVKSTNININEYLKYKNQEFTSDKEDDGTVNGKSVSGSKQQKVWDYIENMNITYTQKIMLYGMEYSLSDNQKKQVVNYINNLNISKQEKLDMLSQFKGFTIYKDGTFKY